MTSDIIAVLTPIWQDKQMPNLKLAHAVVCEGSGIQSSLLSRLRESQCAASRTRHQRVAA